MWIIFNQSNFSITLSSNYLDLKYFHYKKMSQNYRDLFLWNRFVLISHIPACKHIKKTEAKKKKQISWEKTNQFVSIPTITRNISNNVFYQFFLLRKRMQCTNFQSILSHKLNQLTLSMHRTTEHSQSCLEKYVFYSPITCNVCMLQIYCVFGECSEHVRGFVIYFFCIYTVSYTHLTLPTKA